MNILEMAMTQVAREGKLYKENVLLLVLDRMIIIRKYLDMKIRNKKVAIKRWNKRRVGK